MPAARLPAQVVDPGRVTHMVLVAAVFILVFLLLGGLAIVFDDEFGK